MRRKGIVANLLSAVLLGLCFTVPTAHADTIYVSTFRDNTVYKFDSSGNASVFAAAGSGLNYPVGLAFNTNGGLYVANSGGGTGNSTIEEFNSSGQGSLFANSGFVEPWDITFDHNGNLFVSDNSAIEEFNSSGTGSVFATASSGLDLPSGLAFDASGNLYVANYNDTILKFNTNGVSSVFASSGLSNPEALAFDSSGNLYVGNQGDLDILKFNASGIGSVFASGLPGTDYLADQIPEPSSLLLLGLGICALAVSRRPRRSAASLRSIRKIM